MVSTFRFERNEKYYELCREHNGVEQKCEEIKSSEFGLALAHVLAIATREGVLSEQAVITQVGVRVVAPGTYFQSHRLVDDIYLHKLEECAPVAPLHIPHTIAELTQIRHQLPQALLVGVSDSEFHATMPPQARLYPIESEDTVAYDLYRFGYHGLSYASLAKQLPTILPGHSSRVIACHIGSGMSMTALKDGVSIDTTMGFGPGSGLMMGSRVGDIEPAALLELMRQKHMKPLDLQNYLQTRGGFVGLTGESDFRHLLKRYEQNDPLVRAAFDLCRYRIHKTIGAFMAALQGLDAIVLTATAMERSPLLREVLFGDLQWAGIHLDLAKNDELMSRDGMISRSDSAVKVVVVRANEFAELLSATQSFTA